MTAVPAWTRGWSTDHAERFGRGTEIRHQLCGVSRWVRDLVQDQIGSPDHQDLVDQSADWLEDQLGVLNLGQIDFELARRRRPF